MKRLKDYYYEGKGWVLLHANEILWSLVILIGLLTFFIILANYAKTSQTQTNVISRIDRSVKHVDDQLDTVQRNIKKDHVDIQRKEDRLWDCIINLFTDGKRPTSNEARQCRRLADTDREPAPQGSTSANQPDSNSSSSSNRTPRNNNNQPEKPQSPTPPEEPDSILPFVDTPVLGCPTEGLCI